MRGSGWLLEEGQWTGKGKLWSIGQEARWWSAGRWVGGGSREQSGIRCSMGSSGRKREGGSGVSYSVCMGVPIRVGRLVMSL
jgi:hypothetical protein